MNGIRNQYEPLLRAFGKEWPGFLHALLVHLVDSVLSLECAVNENECDDGASRKLFFLDFWVRHLLSRSFLAHFDHSLNRKDSVAIKDSSSPAPFSTLWQMQYPLNALCDRCVIVSQGGSTSCATSRGLAGLFCEILGDQREPGFGIDLATTTVQVNVAAGSLNRLENLKSDSTQKLSLAEIEAMLDTESAAISSSLHMNGKEAETGALSSPAFKPELADSVQDKVAITKSGNTVSVPNGKGDNRHPVGVALISNRRENGGMLGSAGTRLDTSCIEYRGSAGKGPAIQIFATAEANSQPVQPTRSAWIPCKRWDTCAIGVFPGYPC